LRERGADREIAALDGGFALGWSPAQILDAGERGSAREVLALLARDVAIERSRIVVETGNSTAKA